MIEDQAAPLISVVIPTFRPGPELAAVVARVSAVLDGLDFEIILVDDGNDAGGVARIRSAAGRTGNRDAASAMPRCRVLRIERNQGQQRATLAGIRAARGRVTITMDDDGGHPPELLPRMLAALEHRPRTPTAHTAPNNGSARDARRPQMGTVDLVYGVPVRHAATRRRALGSWLNRWIFRVFLGVPRCAAVTSFRAFRTALVVAPERARGAQVERPRRVRSRRPPLPPNLSAMLLSRSPRVACISFEPPASHLTRHSRLSLIRALAALALHWAPRGLLIRALAGRSQGRPRPGET